MVNDNIPNKIDELEKMLDAAIDHIHDCEDITVDIADITLVF